MSKPVNDIDDLFRKGLGGDAGGEIPEGFLADLNERLDALEKRKKKRGAWIWFTPVLLVGAVLGWWMIGNNGQQPAAGQQQAAVHIHEEEAKTIQSAEVNTTGPETVLADQENEPEVQNNTYTTKENTVYHTNTASANTVDANRSMVKRAPVRQEVNGQQNNARENQQGSPTPNETSNNATAIPNANVEGTNAVIANPIVTGETIASDTSSNNPLPVAETLAENPKDSMQAANNPILPTIDPDVAKSENKWSFSVDVRAGVQYVSNIFPSNKVINLPAKSGNTNMNASSAVPDREEIARYWSKRKSEEKEIYAADVSALFNIKKNKWVLSTGLNYSEWGEEIHYSEVIHEIIDYQSYMGSGGVPVITTIRRVEIDSAVAEKNGINKYRFVSVPVLFGYEFAFGRYWSLTPKAGGSFGLPIGDRSGFYLSQELRGPNQVRTNNYLINAQAGIDLGFKLSKFTILFSPYYRRNLNVLISPDGTKEKDQSFPQNKYRAFGVNIGLGFDLK